MMQAISYDFKRFHELPCLNNVVDVVNHIVSMKLLWFPSVQWLHWIFSYCSLDRLNIQDFLFTRKPCRLVNSNSESLSGTGISSLDAKMVTKAEP